MKNKRSKSDCGSAESINIRLSTFSMCKPFIYMYNIKQVYKVIATIKLFNQQK